MRCHNNQISTSIQSSLLKVEKFGRDKKATKKDTVTSNLRWVHEVTGYMQGTGGIAALKSPGRSQAIKYKGAVVYGTPLWRGNKYSPLFLLPTN